jgi:dTDP-4-dehydrorhamnose 3,5-epimerase
MIKIKKARLDGILVLEPKIFQDNRGMFLESYSKRNYQEAGVREEFVQDNHSVSQKGTLRGLHYQAGKGQAKLVRVTQGEVFDVVVDIRKESPTFGQWEGIIISAENFKQVYIPVGFAHGFYVLSQRAEFLYKCSEYYSPKEERGVRWNDPDIAIDWPDENPILSDKDKCLPFLREI